MPFIKQMRRRRAGIYARRPYINATDTNLWSSFSISENLRYLVDFSKDANPCKLDRLIDLRPIDGIKVLTLLWTIVIHSCNFSFQWLHFDNVQQVKDIYTTLWTQWIANGTFSVDNFLLISGLLASMRSIKRDQPENVFRTIIKRYFRLMPPMILAILISKNLLQYFGDGPNWTNSTLMFDMWCRRYRWVINLFALHNFIDTSNMCFCHSWYIAVELQLFVIIQILQYLLVDRWSIGSRYFSLSLTALCICSQLFTSSFIYFFDLPAMPLLPARTDTAMNEYYGRLYIKPFYWLTSYTTGVLLGLFLPHHLASQAVHRSSQAKNRLSRFANFNARCNLHLPNICVLILIILLVSNLPYFRSKQPMTRAVAASYAFLARPIWSISMSILVYRLIKKRREKIHWLRGLRNLLSKPIWRPLTRLSFASYLFHPIVMAAFYGSRTETFVMTPALMFYFTTGNIVLTYLAALLFYLLIEQPLSRIVKLLIS